MCRLWLYETVFPDYRLALFQGLKERYGSTLTLACDQESFSPTLRTAREAESMIVPLENHFWARRNLLWQEGLFPPRA